MTRASAAVFLVLITACSRPPAGRLAVLRIENLSGDPAWDWTARAAAHALAIQTSAIDAGTAPASEAEPALIAAKSAARFVHSYLTSAGGRLRLVVSIAETAGGEPQVVSASGDARQGVLPLVDSVARAIQPSPKPYGTRDDRALRALFEESPAAALAIDPRFDEARSAAMRPEGETAFRARDFARAAQLWAEVVKTSPADEAVWNGLAYARAYAGDIDGALAAIDQYRQLKPDDPNVYDSLGEIYFLAGRFADAERAFLDAYAKNAQFYGGAPLAKAAQSRLAAGDRAGAETIIGRYFIQLSNRKDRGTGEAQARWRLCAGDRAKGIEMLRTLELPEALAERMLWLTAEGRRAEAREAVPKMGTPATAIAAFVSLPTASAAEWSARANSAFSGPLAGLKDVALAYALLLDGKAKEAEPLLREILSQSRPTPGDATPALIAWSLEAQGRKEEAAVWRKQRYLDPYTGPNPIASLACRVFDHQ